MLSRRVCKYLLYSVSMLLFLTVLVQAQEERAQSDKATDAEEQDKRVGNLYREAGLQSDKATDAEEQDKIVEDLNNAPRFVAYRAFVNNDTSLCNVLDKNSSEDCWRSVRAYKIKKAISEGNCNNIPNDASDEKELCRAINGGGGCTSFSGYKQMICQGLVDNNLGLVVRAFTDSDFPEYVRNPTRYAKDFLAFYHGFKDKSESACLATVDPDLRTKAACNMLFGSHNFEKNFQDISRDVLSAVKAKARNNSSLCSSILDDSVKNACYNKAIHDKKGILDEIWY